MTDFSDVRIPATRLGSGSTRARHRLRRHVTKGFYDEAPSGSSSVVGDDIVVNEVNNWTSATTYWFNVYKKTLTSSVAETLAAPGFLGQWLCLNLSGANGFSWGCHMDITEGTTDYTLATFTTDGANLTMIGLDRGGSLRWFVIKNNGGNLS